MAATKKRAKRKTTKKKAAKQPNPAFDFLIRFMKKRPKAAYADAAEACEKAGHKVFPIMWGRAQLLLGRAKPGAGKAKKAAARKAAAGRPGNGRRTSAGKRVGRPRGRPAKQAAGISIPGADVEQLQDLVHALNAGGKAMLQYDGDQWLVVFA